MKKVLLNYSFANILIINYFHVFFLFLTEENKRQQQLLVELGAVTTPFVKYGDGKRLKNDGKKSNELKLFSFRSIATATNNFSNENRIGQGGFGHVYKVSFAYSTYLQK